MQVYTGGIENVIKVWDLRKVEVAMSLKGHTDTVTGLRVSPDGTHLLSNAMVGRSLFCTRSSGCTHQRSFATEAVLCLFFGCINLFSCLQCCSMRAMLLSALMKREL